MRILPHDQAVLDHVAAREHVIVARAIDREIKTTGAACVYLDVTHKPPGFMRERFPFIYEKLRGFGLDCEKQPIPVVPAASPDARVSPG